MFANCALLMHGTGCGGGCRGIDNPITGDMILYIKHFALTLTDMICTAVSNYCVRMGLLVCYCIALYTLMPVILIVYCIYCPFGGPNMLTSCASGFIVATVTANITYEIVISFDYISTHTSANMLFIIIGIGSPCVRMAYLGTVTTAAADVRMRAIMIVSMTSHIVRLLCSCIISSSSTISITLTLRESKCKPCSCLPAWSLELPEHPTVTKNSADNINVHMMGKKCFFKGMTSFIRLYPVNE